jgi:hypothetical protein
MPVAPLTDPIELHQWYLELAARGFGVVCFALVALALIIPWGNRFKKLVVSVPLTVAAVVLLFGFTHNGGPGLF